MRASRGSALPAWVGLALVMGYAALVAATYGSLPEHVATHFSGSGEPNGWMSKEGFVLFQAGMAALLGGVFFGLPRLLARLPASMINVPNREYWTRPENLPELRAILVGYLGWMGVLVLGLMAGLFAVTLRANLVAAPRLPGAAAGIALGVFIAADLVWLVLFLTRFTRVKEAGRTAGPG